MKPSLNCYSFIEREESCRLTSYQDSAGIWTIGYGTITYEDGTRVKQGQSITQARANDLLTWEVGIKSQGVSAATQNTGINQNQFDALVSFAYNVGTEGLRSSTLLKKLKANPKDLSIRNEFAKWNKIHVNGQVVSSAGLTARRKREADLYFS